MELKKDLEDSLRELEDTVKESSQLKLSLEYEKTSNESLKLELAKVRETLENEISNTAKLRLIIDKEIEAKDTALLRNAQVSQEVEIAKQECRQQEGENVELIGRLEALEKIVEYKESQISQSQIRIDELCIRIGELEDDKHLKEEAEGNETMLKNSISDLEEQLNEKTKV